MKNEEKRDEFNILPSFLIASAIWGTVGLLWLFDNWDRVWK